MLVLNLDISKDLVREKIDIDSFSGVDPTFVSRYLIIAVILKAYQKHLGLKELKVLDVGGSGSILNKFIDVNLTIIDILPNEANLPNYFQGSALIMPFADNSFDVVISCDVLEHINKDDRTLFLKESSRVTKDLMITAAPFNLKGVRKAEISANKFYKDMTGEDHRWLFEHLLDELPDLPLAVKVLSDSGMQIEHFSHTSLDNWQLVTRAGFLIAQEAIHPEFVEKIKELNNYYLNHIMQSDFSATGYRSFIIASKQQKVNIKSQPDIYKPELEVIFSMLNDAILKLL
jgi:hypothetical protein